METNRRQVLAAGLGLAGLATVVGVAQPHHAKGAPVIRRGYVRVRTSRPEVSLQAICLGPGGAWSLFQPHGNVFVYQFDDAETDTLICVVNRLNDQTPGEIEIETVWHEYPNLVPIVRLADCYYTEVKALSARACITDPAPSDPFAAW